MKKLSLWLSFWLAILLAFSCAKQMPVQSAVQFADPDVVQKIDDHTLAVATIYAMSEEEWTKRIQNRPRWQQIIPMLGVGFVQQKPARFLAYIGSATVLKDNYAITVSHLFDHEPETYGYKIWAFKRGIDHPIECELVCRGDISKNAVNDYAVICPKENLGVPGLKIATVEPRMGDRVIWSGSVGGLAFFTRFGHITKLGQYLNVPADGRLHLSYFEEFDFWVVYPSGPGDSGGSVKNCRGEIIGILYVGINVYEEQYVFSNPLDFLWAFLGENNLTELGK
jgi:hypothetical protein